MCANWREHLQNTLYHEMSPIKIHLSSYALKYIFQISFFFFAISLHTQMNWNVIDKINIFTKVLFHTQRFILRKKFLQKISMDNNSFLSVLLCLCTYFYEYIFSARNILCITQHSVTLFSASVRISNPWVPKIFNFK